MKLQKSFSIVLAAALCVTMFSGCGSKEPVETTKAPTTEVVSTTAPVAAPAAQDSSNFLSGIALTLPKTITREDLSATQACFTADGAVIGGIDILEKAGQREAPVVEEEYVDFAATVTKTVQEGEYDSSVDMDSGMADVVAEIAFQDGKVYKHYFFFGETVVYDIWADSAVLNGQDMISILKTLRSEDIVNPQDSAPVNEDVPILNLRMEVPSGIIRMPATTSQLLFYNIPSMEQYVTGENVVGGVEAVADVADLKAIETAITAPAEKYLGGAYETASEQYAGTKVVAKITANSAESNVVAFVAQVDDLAYAVWADTSVIAEDGILKIAESLSF